MGAGRAICWKRLEVLAAAYGVVDDDTFGKVARSSRGPGVPQLYRTAFPQPNLVQDIDLGASSDGDASLRVTLWNPKDDLEASWSFKTEKLRVQRAASLPRVPQPAPSHRIGRGGRH